MNLFRKVWLAAKVKAAIGGDVEALKAALGWVFKMGFVPSGWLTVGSGVVSILLGVLCMAGVSIPGIACPTEPTVMLTTGAGLVGLGRRGSK